MALHNTESQMNPAENDFKEFMLRGDDFYKIELLRQAKSWYVKALSLNNDDEKVKFRISECERLLSFENKIVYILLSIASLLGLLYLIFLL